MLRPWLKNMLMACLLTISVWTLFIFYWRANVHMPSTSDVFISFILMPIALLLSVLLIRKVAVAFIAPKVAASPIGGDAVTDENGQEGQYSLQERDWVLPILTGNVVTMHGHAVGDLAEVMSAKTTKFELDPDLVDLNGYPILSGRIADLDETESFTQFEKWESKRGESDHVWLQEDKRTLALAHAVFVGLTEELLTQWELSQLGAEDEIRTNSQDWPEIHLLNLWPAHWIEIHKQSVNRWFGHLLAEQGWPEEKVLISPLNATSIQDTIQDAMALLDRLNLQVHRLNTSGLHILVASQSFLGEKTVEEWLLAERLHTAQNKNGQIPGEAAAGLVLSSPDPLSKFTTAPLAQLHRVSQRKRDKSADDPGKIKPDVLVEAIKDALTVSKVNADVIVKISSDTDARARRVGELMEAVNEVLPDLDLDADCFRLEAACGFMGAASGLTTLVLGWQQCVEHEQPVLCIYNNDSFERTALVINTDPATSTIETTV